MIAHEILTTEKEYCNTLTIIQDVFRKPLEASVKSNRYAISLSHAMRPGLQIGHFWVAKSLFLTITFNQKKQDKTFCF